MTPSSPAMSSGRELSPEIEATLARRLRGGLSGGRPDLTLIGVPRHEMALWDIAGKAAGKPVHELLGGRVRDSLRPTATLYAEPGDATDVYPIPSFRGAKRAGRRRARLHGDQVLIRRVRITRRSTWRQPSPGTISIAASATSARSARLLARAAISSSGRMAEFTVSGAIRLARCSSASTRSGSMEPTPPEAPEEMIARRAGDVDPDRDGREADDEARVRARACDWRGVHPADEHRSRRRPARGPQDRFCYECHRSDCPSHSTAAWLLGAAEHPACDVHDELPHPRGGSAADGIHAALLQQPIRWGGRYVPLPEWPWLWASSSTRRGRALHTPTTGRTCISAAAPGDAARGAALL